jgi:putative YhbY family RNA-binding protein
MPTLTSAARRALRAKAHPLQPVVTIGTHGLTPALLHEIDIALNAHELIKVRVFDDDRAGREALMARVCAEARCAPVQHIGKLLVLWRATPEPAPVAAKAKTKPAASSASRRRVAR